MADFPSRQVVIALSWRFGAELIRRYPRRLTLVETHPNGIYDCLTVVDRAGPAFDCIHMNRDGVITVFFGNGENTIAGQRPTWDEILRADDPKVPPPVLAFEARHGKAWDTTGKETDLFAGYRQHGRLWPVVWTVAGHLLS